MGNTIHFCTFSDLFAKVLCIATASHESTVIIDVRLLVTILEMQASWTINTHSLYQIPSRTDYCIYLVSRIPCQDIILHSDLNFPAVILHVVSATFLMFWDSAFPPFFWLVSYVYDNISSLVTWALSPLRQNIARSTPNHRCDKTRC